mmetsp:Transcript_3430/g.6499  ORF Transcript_3430/g.6499 Transcript_3430/m.6499 type:complete len:358 (-) Transcript_3430:186-1259(-)
MSNLRVKKIKPLIPPAILLEEEPSTAAVRQFVVESRNTVSKIISGEDDRLLLVVGPCSIHDVDAARDYAHKLLALSKTVQKHVFIVMRVYFEKPRTTVGWKGLINDPHLNGSYDINVGLRVARKLLLEINGLGLPVGCELLDTISPQFISDLMTWGAIGARTTESQLHRELVSGLSMPVGFKNGSSGDTKVAVDAIVSASSPHSFLGVTEQGLAAIVQTTGNSDCHIILRGGEKGTNYSPVDISLAVKKMKKRKITPAVVVDCSHGNSGKEDKYQPLVLSSVASQVAAGNTDIIGLMVESFLVSGAQKLVEGDRKSLTYGQSITDKCVDFETTERMVQELVKAVEQRRLATPLAAKL